ncbi:MAG: aldo/keto reductase [Gammaproteobacteria bacterium]
MLYRSLGRSGLKLSVLSLGSWVTFATQVDEASARDLMACAFERGVTFFDNAESYAFGESERLMGRAIQKLGWPRDRFCVSSKAFFGSVPQPIPTQHGLSRKHLVEACHQALSRLQVDYLDLFFCHRADPDTPVEEIVTTMQHLIYQGKILYWGTSEWPAALIETACRVAESQHTEPPVMEQPQYNLFVRKRVEEEYRSLCQDSGIGLTTWSPLASGVLTGKYAPGESISSDGGRLRLPGYEWLAARLNTVTGTRQLEASRKLIALARDHGTTASQLAIAWCLSNPHVSSVILGASRKSQLLENLSAVDWVHRMSPELTKEIEALYPDPE